MADAMTATNLGALADVVPQDLLNGAAAQLRSVVVHASVTTAYKQVRIVDLTPEAGQLTVSAMIRSTWANYTANQPDGVNQSVSRKNCILMGAVRAANELYWRVGQRLNPAESIQAIYRYVPAAGGVAHSMVVADGADAAMVAAAQGMADLTEEEQGYIAALQPAFISALPLAGASLLSCGHHYLSDPGRGNQSRRAAEAVEKQFFVGTELNAWLAEDLAAARNAMWHKASHPVQIGLKEAVARDFSVRDKLIAAGMGSTAARLPFTVPERKAANSYLTVIAQGRGLIEAAGGEADATLLECAAAAYDSFAAGAGRPVGMEQLPASVVDLDSAILWLATALTRAEGTAAYCLGLVARIKEAADVTSGPMTTILTSYSLGKLNNTPGYMQGTTFAAQYRAWERKKAEAGELVAPVLSCGAIAPVIVDPVGPDPAAAINAP